MSRFRLRRWIAVLCLTVVVTACSDATVTPSTVPLPTVVPATAAPSAPTAPPFAPASYPDGAVDCAGGTYAGRPYVGNLRSIAAPDPRTVVFELCEPDVAFLARIASPSFAINDAQWLEGMIAPGATEGQAIVTTVNGTGPFRLERWDPGAQLELRANPDHWAGAPAMETLIFLWDADSTQRFVEIRSDTVDGIDDVAPGDIDTIRSDPSLQLKEREGLNTTYLGLNRSIAPFDNESVRQAIAMGIDRQRIVDETYPEGSRVASHFAPCAVLHGCAGEAWYEFDLASAQALLAQAGFADGLTTVIRIPEPSSRGPVDARAVASALRDQLRENLDIEAEIQSMAAPAFREALAAGTLDGIHIGDWSSDTPDASAFLDPLFGSAAPPAFGVPLEEVVAALRDGAAVSDDAGREAAYAAANGGIRARVPVVPIGHAGSAAAYRADIAGAVHASPIGQESFAMMQPDRPQFVWMQSAEPLGLYCADETDRDSLRACRQLQDSLYRFEVAGTTPEPALAEHCDPSADLMVWTCTLRDGVTFHNGAVLDANDVLQSFAVQWDAAHPRHLGRTGSFATFARHFGGFLNTPEG